MANKTIRIGITSLKVAEVQVGGKPGTVFVSLGQTYEDSFNSTVEDGNVTGINVEEQDDAIYEHRSKGAKTISWQIPNPDMEQVVKIFGGTYLAGKYSAPRKMIQKDVTVQVEFELGGKWTYNRVSLVANFDGQVGRNNAQMLSISGRVLAPTDGTSPIEIAEDN